MANKPPKPKGPPPSLQETLTAARVSAKPLGLHSKNKKPTANAPPGPRTTGQGGRPNPAPIPERATGAKGATGWEKRVPWDPGKLKAFIAGELTLAQLEGISTEEQYAMAKSGHSFLLNDRIEDAEKVFLGLTALNPKDAYFQLALGSVRQRQGDYEAASVCYNRALAINPQMAAAYANRGEVLILQGNLLEGAKDLGRAIHLDPRQLEPSTQRARATLDLLRSQAAAAQKAAAPKTSAKPRRPDGPRKRPQGRAPAPRGKPGPRSGPAPRSGPRRKPKPRS